MKQIVKLKLPQAQRWKDLQSGALRPPLKKWVDYLEDFMAQARLFPRRQSSSIVALSGGMDSIALLFFLTALQARGRIGTFKAIYVDHQLRQESKAEGQELRRWCDQLGIEFKVLTARRLTGGRESFVGGMENSARMVRYRLFEDELAMGESLFLGHHLDDSYEWHLMQKFQVARLERTLGIAVRSSINQRVRVRPLMCFSKQQLQNFLALFSQNALFDRSNLDVAIRRNWLRHQTGEFGNMYPQYLKFYVQQMNQLARLLNVSAFKDSPAAVCLQDRDGHLVGIVTQGRDEQLQNDQLAWLKSQSLKKRGKFASQLTIFNRLKAQGDFKNWDFAPQLKGVRHGPFFYLYRCQHNRQQTASWPPKYTASQIPLLNNLIKNRLINRCSLENLLISFCRHHISFPFVLALELKNSDIAQFFAGKDWRPVSRSKGQDLKWIQSASDLTGFHWWGSWYQFEARFQRALKRRPELIDALGKTIILHWLVPTGGLKR